MKKTYILLILWGLLFLPQAIKAQCIATSTATFEACLANGATSIEIPKRTPIPYAFTLTDVDISGVIIEMNNAVIIFSGNIIVDENTRFFGEGNALILIVDPDGDVFTASGNSGNNTNTSFSELNDSLASGSFSNLLDALSDAGGILPVTLSSFTGRPTPTGVQLTWATVTELNNDYFEIQHSRDGRSFATVEIVEGNGTTYEPQEYRYLHKDPAPGVNYYRLRQVDYDGAFEIHPVIAVTADGAASGPVTVFPNPAADILQVRWAVAGERPTQLRLFDATGRVMGTYDMDEKTAAYELPLQGLPAGMYVLQLTTGQVTETVRFKKQ